MSQEYIIISDLHENPTKAIRAMGLHPDAIVVLNGDYFDSHRPKYGDKPFDVIIDFLFGLDKKVILHVGNHDIGYLETIAAYLRNGVEVGTPTPLKIIRQLRYPLCSGFQEDLLNRLHARLKEHEDPFAFINRFRFMTKIGKHIVSHAGLRSDKLNLIPALLDYTMEDFIKNDPAKEATIDDGVWNPIRACGRRRGGNDGIGGILWQDDREVKPSEVHQIVGHTPMTHGKFDKKLNHTFIDADDTYAHIVDDECTVKRLPFGA